MANVGYVRVSSVEQNTVRQLADLKVQLDKVFEDKVSGATTDRPQLQAMLEYVREGDTIYVHDISRLARNLADLLTLVKDLTTKGISVRFDKENLTFTGEDSPMQNLMLSMLGAVYQFERSMIKERQLEGVAQAKLEGKYKGRPKTIDDTAIQKLIAEGVSYRKAAEQLGLSLSTVQRAMRNA
jgi:DNA invertase Pin-like site-specific DNA recombinase